MIVLTGRNWVIVRIASLLGKPGFLVYLRISSMKAQSLSPDANASDTDRRLMAREVRIKYANTSMTRRASLSWALSSRES